MLAFIATGYSIAILLLLTGLALQERIAPRYRARTARKLRRVGGYCMAWAGGCALLTPLSVVSYVASI